MMIFHQASCFLLLIIILGFSNGQREEVKFSNQDGFAFPGEVERPSKFPLPRNNPIPQPIETTSSRSAVNPGADPDDITAYNQCTDQCVVTSEYNPVCGTDNVVYTNPGRLSCAQYCGRSVEIASYGQCTGSGRG